MKMDLFISSITDKTFTVIDYINNTTGFLSETGTALFTLRENLGSPPVFIILFW